MQGFPGLTGEYNAFTAAEKAALRQSSLERKGIFHVERGSGSSSSSSSGDSTSRSTINNAGVFDEQKSGRGQGSRQGQGQRKQVGQGGVPAGAGTQRNDGKTCRARHFEPWVAPPPLPQSKSQPQSQSNTQPHPAPPSSYGIWQWLSSLVTSMSTTPSLPRPR